MPPHGCRSSALEILFFPRYHAFTQDLSLFRSVFRPPGTCRSFIFCFAPGLVEQKTRLKPGGFCQLRKKSDRPEKGLYRVSSTVNSLHNLIDFSHIYKTKPESWFKFLGLAVAWFGGFFWLAPSINITQYSVAFFVYL
jgi:hypothetical protein